jgi:mannose-1-phosphate guanylyltransferase
MIHPNAKIGQNVTLGPDVIIGPDVVIADNARVKRSTLLSGVHVKSSALISNSIIGWKSTIGAWARVTDSTLGEDVTVQNEVAAHDVIVCPHKSIGEDVLQGKIIM